MYTVLLPDGVVPNHKLAVLAVMLIVLIWGVEGVVDGGNEEEDVGDQSRDLVYKELLARELLTTGKGVDYIRGITVNMARCEEVALMAYMASQIKKKKEEKELGTYGCGHWW